MSFAAQQTRIAARVFQRRDAFVRGLVLSIGTDLIVPSPVDTGRFRANWRAAVDEIDGTVDALCDKSGAVSIARAAAAAEAMAMGDVVYLTNSLHYAAKLEYGWSKQAPFGMVRVTMARVPVLVADVLRSIP